MAVLKEKVLFLDNGRKIKLHGDGLGINHRLEISIGALGSCVLALEKSYRNNSDLDPVSNPHNLSKEEMAEVAECMIGLWWKFKENVKKHGVNSVDLFKEE